MKFEIPNKVVAQKTFTYEGRWIVNWFSNRFPFDQALVYQGIVYTTPENLYQAMKTKDAEERARIAAMSPKAAKQAGKRLSIRPDWKQVKESYMLIALHHKFQPGTSWHRKLMETGVELIVEFNNWPDNYWGHCICQSCQAKPKQNRLGVLLMQVRASYQPQKGMGSQQAQAQEQAQAQD